MTRKQPSSAPPSSDGEDLLAIGEVAEATGLSPDTIRVWERRYGRPEAVRLPSGHRRYTAEHLRWLRRVTEALALGHRPSDVVALDEDGLDALLAKEAPEEIGSTAIQRLVGQVADLDEAGLRSALKRDAARNGPSWLVRERVAPLLVAVGRAWADGDVDVRHEHFLTQIVEDVLRGLRNALPAPRRAGAPTLLLATLPEEKHGLGLQMTALLGRVAGLPVRILGTETPIEEIADAAREAKASVVGVSVSLATGGVQTDRQLAELRDALPKGTRLLVGGEGARGPRRGPRGIEYIEDIEELERWLARLAAGDDGR